MKFKGYFFPPVDFLRGIQVEYPRMVSDPKKTVLTTLDDYQDLLDRLKAIPRMIHQIIQLLKQGVEEGFTFAKESMTGVDAQFEKLQVQVGSENSYMVVWDGTKIRLIFAVKFLKFNNSSLVVRPIYFF